MVRVDGMLWPGDLNDANGILEHRGVFHAMFQTPVWQNGVNGTGQPPACHGDLALCGPHAWAHVVSENGVRWRRLRDILTPTNGSAVDGVDGDCDGTLSFPEGIGPTILFGADCAVPVCCRHLDLPARSTSRSSVRTMIRLASVSAWVTLHVSRLRVPSMRERKRSF